MIILLCTLSLIIPYCCGWLQPVFFIIMLIPLLLVLKKLHPELSYQKEPWRTLTCPQVVTIVLEWHLNPSEMWMIAVSPPQPTAIYKALLREWREGSFCGYWWLLWFYTDSESSVACHWKMAAEILSSTISICVVPGGNSKNRMVKSSSGPLPHMVVAICEVMHAIVNDQTGSLQVFVCIL